MNLACVAYEGHDYLLVMDGPTVLAPERVQRLAVSHGPGQRALRCVLVDEAVPGARGGNLPFEVRGFRWCEPLPVEVDCGGFPHRVGWAHDLERRPPGATPGTLGWHVLGTVRLDESLLADLVWHGLRTSLLTACCVRASVEVQDDEVNRAGEFTALRLDAPARVCLPGARVLDFWVERP